MSKYHLQRGNGGEQILMIDGIMSRCPFTPPIAIPDPISMQMKISMIPCSTICPLAQVFEGDMAPEKYYEMKCGSSKIAHRISEEDTLSNNNDSGIIRMN